MIKVILPGVANNVLTSLLPLNIVLALSVVADKTPALTIPVNVAPLKLALVVSCELINVTFAGVANNIDTSLLPLNIVPALKVVALKLGAVIPPVNVAPLKFAFVTS